jgi:hypothetical protein
MFYSKKVQWISWEIVNYDKIVLLGTSKDAAMAVFDAKERFIYDGNNNHDLAKHTWIMEKIDGKWKLKHNHRAVGKPVEE